MLRTGLDIRTQSVSFSLGGGGRHTTSAARLYHLVDAQPLHEESLEEADEEADEAEGRQGHVRTSEVEATRAHLRSRGRTDRQTATDIRGYTGRGRERETDLHTETEAERHTKTDTERHTKTDTERHTETDIWRRKESDARRHTNTIVIDTPGVRSFRPVVMCVCSCVCVCVCVCA